jgi:hypothetical protein
MWEYICPRCHKSIKQDTHKCPYCGESFPLALRIPPTFLKDKKKLVAYVHKYVFPRVSEFERNYLAKYFTVYFTDGQVGTLQETHSDLSAWSGVEGDATVNSLKPHHGNNNFDFSQGGDVYKDFGAGGTFPTPWMRAYFWLTSMGTTANAYSDLLSLRDSTGAFRVYALLHRTGSTNYFAIYCPGDGTIRNTSIAPDLNKWYALEIGYTQANPGGPFLYVDDFLRYNESLNTSAYGNCRFIYLGAFTYDTLAYHTYADCVVAADTHIGLEVGVIMPKGSMAAHAKLAGII